MRPQLMVVAAAAAILLAGCATPLAGMRDPISAGTAKLLLDVGKTTQTEVLESFGGPNIVAGDAAGKETWTYDRMSYEASSAAGGGAAAGVGTAGSGGGVGLIWGQASSASTSSRTVTLFLYWEEGVLVDYKYRSVTF